MTPSELRTHCDSFNDETGRGGVTKLAVLLGWTRRTMDRKIFGQHKITQSDEIAINDVMQKYHVRETR
jgi:hypothetical protein